MVPENIRAFLDRHRVSYATISHSQAFTAQEVAAAAHIRGREIAKTVIVKIGGRLAMVVLPASLRLSTELLSEIVGTPDVRLANEYEFESFFPGCELGAMPPFGNLYGMEVYVHPKLAEDEAIAFNAGTHTELIRMDYADFEKLVHPKVLATT